jgi:hypothetical protein
MVFFRTYLSDLARWRSGRGGPAPVLERERLASWMLGRPHPNGDGGFSIPFDRIPDRVIVHDGSVVYGSWVR